MTYRVREIVDSTNVPDWKRRPTKWSELVEAALKLNPGQSLVVEFDKKEIAERAKNSVRDTVNLKLGGIYLRTRKVLNDDGSIKVFFMRVSPSDATALE